MNIIKQIIHNAKGKYNITHINMETMEITYTTEDKSMNIKLVYLTRQRLTLYRGNKTYPTVTQCLMYKNGLLYNFAEVVKHREDKNNTEYAMKLVTKKVLTKMKIKCVRKSIWEVLNVSLKIK